jgi:quercetin dioxygenase-like cupin family protein
MEMGERPRRETTTGGSDEREGRSLIGPLLRFELAEEAGRLRAEAEYRDGDRNAKTLAKAGPFRLVLVAFRAGAAFDEDDQRGSVALHVLEGRMTVRVGQDQVEIGEGEVAVVPSQNPWAAVALGDGLLLAHLSWPPEPGSVATARPGRRSMDR